MHEIVHAWNGGLITWQPDAAPYVFQSETWLAEGGTVYLTARLSSDLGFYREALEDALDDYQEELTTIRKSYRTPIGSYPSSRWRSAHCSRTLRACRPGRTSTR